MHYENISGHFDAENVYRFAVAEASNGAHFLEVGPSTARSTCFLAETIRASHKDIQLDVVGTFPDNQYDVFLSQLEEAGVAESVLLRRMPADEAARLFAPGSFDFVFLGPVARATGFVDSLALWQRSVRPGGILAGHGFSNEWPWLMRAVEDCFGSDCAAPPRAWAVRRMVDKAQSRRLAFTPAKVPATAPDHAALQHWHRAVFATPDPLLVLDAARFGEAAVETLLFLLRSEDAAVQRAACCSLVALLTPGVGVSEVARAVIQGGLEDLREDKDLTLRRQARAALRFLQEDEDREAQRRLCALRDAPRAARPRMLRALQALPREAVARAYRPVPEERLWDCLNRATIMVPPLPHCVECVVTLACKGDAPRLADFLNALTTTGMVPGTGVVVLLPHNDTACADVCRRHGAAVVPYTCQDTRATSRVSLLWSVARIIAADRYLCLGVDVVVRGPLRPLFAAMEALHEESLLVCPAEDSPAVTARRTYSAQDLTFLTGQPHPPLMPACPSIFGGRRRAMLGLDRSIRLMQPFAAAWIDGARSEGLSRDASVFSLAVASPGVAVGLRIASGHVEVLREGRPEPLLRLPDGAGRSVR